MMILVRQISKIIYHRHHVFSLQVGDALQLFLRHKISRSILSSIHWDLKCPCYLVLTTADERVTGLTTKLSLCK